jgi:hypothetical protein
VIRACALAAACALGAGIRGACAEGAWGEAPIRRISGPLSGVASDSASAAAAFLSLENPYSIEGLVASRIEAEASGGIFAVGAAWSRLSHALYREDRLSGAIAFATPVPGVMIGVESGFLRRQAAGFRGERSFPVRLVAAWRRSRSAAVLLAVPVFESGAAARVRSSWSCLASFGTFALGVAAFSPDGLSTEHRLDASVSLAARATLRTAYACRSGELSTGVCVEIRRCIFGFSWSVHPVLGMSSSAGAGRRWTW